MFFNKNINWHCLRRILIIIIIYIQNTFNSKIYSKENHYFKMYQYFTVLLFLQYFLNKRSLGEHMIKKSY